MICTIVQKIGKRFLGAALLTVAPIIAIFMFLVAKDCEEGVKEAKSFLRIFKEDFFS